MSQIIRTLIAGAVAILLVWAGVAAVSFILWYRLFYVSSVNEFHVAGTVVDATSGVGVANAHVIVVATPMGFDANGMCFGVIADAQGRFDVRYKHTAWLRPDSLAVLASSPTDDYGELGVSKTAQVVNNCIEATNATINTQPLPLADQGKSNYKYATFSKGCSGASKPIFINGRW